MPSFFDLMKYARTGIASPDMTGFDKLRAKAAFGGYPVTTLTGVPPISFKADGTPLTAWSIAGNMVQDGTPTPDAPIMPDFVGVRTANLWDGTYFNGVMDTGEFHDRSSYEVYTSCEIIYIPVTQGESYSFSTTRKPVYAQHSLRSSFTTETPAVGVSYKINDTNTFVNHGMGAMEFTRTAPESAKYMCVQINPKSGLSYDIMLNTGSTALPYEPYGYKIQITNAGQTTPVYLGQVSTVRRVKKLVLTGSASEQYTKLNSSDTNYVYRTDVTNVRMGSVVSHLSSTDSILTQVGFNQNPAYPTVFYFNFGADIMNAQTSGNTVAGLKEYLAAQYAAGTPVTVWYVLATSETGIVNEPLCKIGDYADELHSTDAGVTIPTAKGANVLTVDTTLQPSSMTITGNIKPQ